VRELCERDSASNLPSEPARNRDADRPGAPSLELLTTVDFDEETPQQALASGRHYDPQTGLPSYEAFRKLLAIWLEGWPADREIALVWIDLLNLRREFSLRGWTGAESLVRLVADVLRSALDETALVCRFSGRCFVVAMEAGKFNRRHRRRIQALPDAIRSAQHDRPESGPQIAAGVAFYPADSESPEELVRFASIAAARAEYLKSPTVIPFHAAMNRLAMRDHELEVEIQRGLDRGDFTTVYQPKLDLVVGSILGAETLIRWNHPEWGPVAPAEFIPTAERCGLIHRIFELTLRSALNDARRWEECGIGIPIITVNASAENLRRADFAASVRRMLREHPIAPTQLELEITESVLLDDDSLFAARVRQLKEIGVRMAIDDFGTRYTGFNLLRRLPLDVIKIDKCFIRGVDRCADTRAICQAIVAMARQLRMRCVAEGVEERGELEALRQVGCEAGQGYLFLRPADEPGFARFLREWPARRNGFGFAQTAEPLESAPVCCAV
jgi:EAL domain-containing protein (putative c-di-GMP-specific phosphodiesterase class I)/GGDEF domain-containing protein